VSSTIAAPRGSLGTRIGSAARDPGFWGDNAVLFGLVLVVVAFSLATPVFLTLPNISDVLVAAAILVVIAIGQQFAIVVGGIDLSIASNLPWTAVLFGLAFTHGVGIPGSMAIAIAGGGVTGFANGFLITKLKVNDFIVTLGMLGVLNGLALIVTNGQSLTVNSTFLEKLALGSLGPIRYVILIALVIALLARFLFLDTSFGMRVLATGGNRDAARNMGLSVDVLRIAVYTIGGALVGIAGILLVARTGGSDPSLQTSQLLSSIAAVVLGGASLAGGRASIVGTVAGALLLTVLLNGFTLMQVSEYYQPIAVGVVVIASAVLGRLQR